MTDHKSELAHYTAQGDHAKDLAELKRLRAEVERKDAINAELAAVLQQLYTFNACRMSDSDIAEDHRMQAARAALAKAKK